MTDIQGGNKVGRAYYSSEIQGFLACEADQILGQLLLNDAFKTEDSQKNAWREEIFILKEQLAEFSNGGIIFEFTIPRIGHRIDVVLIVDGILFLLEFKVGDRAYRKSTEDQVIDYALDLKYFHEASKERIIVPMIVATEAMEMVRELSLSNDCISEVLYCNRYNIGDTIRFVLSQLQATPLTMESWLNARYAPTPTIIEAAQILYRNHSVKEISRNDAGATNLTETTKTINRIIDCCKARRRKAICFVTGVPGAGKTLAGLNIANERHQFDSEEHAVFLSGNGPLVDILQEALARDRVKATGMTKAEAKRETKAFIQAIHKFRDEAIVSQDPPIEKVAIFDEAQRAWDAQALGSFMAKKKGTTNFVQSEPEFLISVMDRHEDWAVIVCLVGGGQEIHTGEAGISEWLDAVQKRFPFWNIYLSDQMTDSEYVGDGSMEELLRTLRYEVEPSLHLGISLRSFRSEKLSGFVKALLDGNMVVALKMCEMIREEYPIVLTRELERAKDWVKRKARGTERYGLLASAEGKRLRGVGIQVASEIDHVGWFLNGKEHVNSSYYLEVPASEFKVQGLEIDYALLAWDADFRYIDGDFEYYRFRGTKWNHIHQERRKKYLKNAYRVLLTRARQGLVIFIPQGDLNDATRRPEYYDGTYNYLRRIGICEI